MTKGEITMPGLGRWNDDIRLEMLRSVVGVNNEPSQDDADTLLRTISSLARHVAIRRRSVVPGLGTFEWHDFKKRLPDGRIRKCIRLNLHVARKERDIARAVFRTGRKPRNKSALPYLELAVEAARKGKAK